MWFTGGTGVQDSSIAIVLVLGAAALLGLVAFAAVLVLGGGLMYLRGRGNDADEPHRRDASRPPSAAPASQGAAGHGPRSHAPAGNARIPSAAPSAAPPSAAPRSAAPVAAFESIPPVVPLGSNPRPTPAPASGPMSAPPAPGLTLRDLPLQPGGPAAPPPPSNLRSTVSPSVPPARKPGLLGFFDEPAPDSSLAGGNASLGGEGTRTELFQRGKAPPSWLAPDDGEDEGEATEIFSAHHLDFEEGFAALEDDTAQRGRK